MDQKSYSAPESSIDTVTVFAGSGARVADVYRQDAFDLGKLIAEEGWVQVNGGGSTGLMLAATTGAKSAGGIVDTVILDIFIGTNEHSAFRNQYVFKTLDERKGKLISMGDAIISLPGGLGTVDELMDVACSRQLGFHTKPIIIVNTNGFFDGLRQFIQHAVNEKFVTKEIMDAVLFADNAKHAVQLLKDFKHVNIDKTCVNSGEMEAADMNAANDRQ